MAVQDKPCLPQWLPAYPRHRRDIEGLEDGIDADYVATGDRRAEIHRLAVYEDQVDLGVRYAERFDQMFDRLMALEGVVEGGHAALGRQKVVQFGIEPEARLHDLILDQAAIIMYPMPAPLRALAVRGPFRGPSGYDHHVREFVRELHRRGVSVELSDQPGWTAAKLPDEARDPWFDTLSRDVGARVMLHFTTPQYAFPQPGLRNVNFTMFEATRIPAVWVGCHRAHDAVILPAESSRRAWIASGVPAGKIRMCPLGIDPARFSASVAPLEIGLERRTRFLNVSELSQRKNLQGLLRAWLKATTPQDDAVLVMKTGAWTPGAAARFQESLVQGQRELGKRLADAAPVVILREILSDSDMPRLYAAATHYWSMSFGEGWDQAMMEAAASGLQLIAPAHSAYLTYLDAASATLLPCREIPVVFPGDAATAALFRDACWWEPDEDSAVAAIRAAIENTGPAKASPRDRILNEFTWDKATARLIGILSEFDRPRRKLWFF
jgi:glycosyltransferase involved in cell wall biosynthesis